MDMERAQNESLLTAAELKAQQLEVRLEHLRDAIRQAYGRFRPARELAVEDGLNLAVEINAVHIQYLEVLARIAAIKKALGK